MPKPSSAARKPLLACSHHLSQKARLALLTLLILIGVTWGLWLARPSQLADSQTATTRSGGSTTLCKHASVAFAPELSIQQMGQLLRAEDAYIMYGPDEFGEYQLRFASHTPVEQAMAHLRAQPGVLDVMANPHCP